MAISHARMRDEGSEFHVTARTLANGAILVVTVKTPADTRTVERIRGLGFAGLMTEGIIMPHTISHSHALTRSYVSTDFQPRSRCEGVILVAAVRKF